MLFFLDKVSISTILKTPTRMQATVTISFRDQISGKNLLYPISKGSPALSVKPGSNTSFFQGQIILKEPKTKPVKMANVAL